MDFKKQFTLNIEKVFEKKYATRGQEKVQKTYRGVFL